MTDVTNILDQIEEGDPSAAEKLLPLVYDELRILAAHRLENEKPGQTLQATALNSVRRSILSRPFWQPPEQQHRTTSQDSISCRN